MRGTLYSDHWYLGLPEQAMAPKLSSVGLWLNTSKSESVLERDDHRLFRFLVEYE